MVAGKIIRPKDEGEQEPRQQHRNRRRQRPVATRFGGRCRLLLTHQCVVGMHLRVYEDSKGLKCNDEADQGEAYPWDPHKECFCNGSTQIPARNDEDSKNHIR